jgi:hypothetical protein
MNFIKMDTNQKQENGTKGHMSQFSLRAGKVTLRIVEEI